MRLDCPEVLTSRPRREPVAQRSGRSPEAVGRAEFVWWH